MSRYKPTPAPADHAATDLTKHREVLVAVLNDARPSPDWAWEILTTWDALVAQAETAENWKASCARYLAARQAAEARLAQAEQALREIVDAGFIGEAINIARAALTEDEGCEYHRPLFVKGCRDCAALTEDTP